MKENSYAESLQAVLTRCSPGERELVPLTQALGRVLAGEVRALEDDPPAPKSRMDGYALRSTETGAASPERPVTLAYGEVVGAGHLAESPVEPGGAVRLMTGALLPRGADAVVKLEDTRPAGGGRFSLSRPLSPGENVSQPGAFMGAGELLLKEGERITSRAWGVLAGQGKSMVAVRRQPRVALLAMGDELVEPGSPRKTGQLFASNIFTLQAEAARAGADSRSLGIAPDNPEAIIKLLEPCLRRPGREADPTACQIIITLGGSHGGDFDFAHRVLLELGAEVHFRRTRLSPGASTIFATLGGSLLFGLPGTPGAAWIVFEVLVRPAIHRLTGPGEAARPLLPARLTAPLKAEEGRDRFVAGWLDFRPDGLPSITPLTRRRPGAGPHSLLANALIHLTHEAASLAEGEEVMVMWLGGDH